MLEVRLIGRFDIQCDGKPVILSSRSAQSLFAYLILTAGTLHRREKLAGMLWPDESEQKARAYLRNELWRIRKVLSQTSNIEYLLADNLTVGFNQSSVHWLDVAGLKKLSDTASAEQLFQALSSYQGELLPGFYEDWVVLDREHLQVLFEQKVACLLEMLEKEQRWQDILGWAERWISLAQAPEAAYRSLMVAYGALEDHAKVISTYERCRQALHQLDLEPSEQTRAVALKRTPKLNIPIPLNSFIGREKELTEIATLLSKCRLVTLTGSGGVGKTRLAIQVVADVIHKFPDGIWFLDLAPLNDGALVPNTLADVLGLREFENSKLSISEVLINYLHSRTALILFDNCEHLIEACAHLAKSLLTSCERLSILATSREAMRVSGEIPYRVPSLEIYKLGVESAVDEISEIEAVKLFIERATASSPGFVAGSEKVFAIAQICQRLDGIPLAIELAAARAHMLTVSQILKRLDDRFKFLTQGVRTALQRHQTLRATIEWSYDLLSETERLLFRRLSVFSGGWTLEAVEEVCVGQNEIFSNDILDLLTQLVNKSLVVVMDYSQSGETRYRMLETIRQYARERLLEAGGSEVMRDRHIAYFVKLTEQAAPELYRSNQVFWLSKFDDELDNLRMALEWALERNVEAGLRIATTPWQFWSARGYLQELGNWLGQLLELYETVDSLHVRALVAYSGCTQSRSIAEQSLQMARTLSDRQSEALSLMNLGTIISVQGDLREGIPMVEQSLDLFRELGDPLYQAYATGWLSLNNNDLERTKTLMIESLRLFRQLGHLWGIANSLRELASLTIWGGDFSSPTQWLEEARAIYRQLGDQSREGHILELYGRLSFWIGDFQKACVYYEEAIKLEEKFGYSLDSDWTRAHMAYALLRQGNITQAKEMFKFCVHRFQNMENIGGLVFAIEGLASLNINQEKYEVAIRLFAWSDAMREKIGDSRPPVEQNSVERDLAVIQSQLDKAEFAKLSEEGKAMTTEQAIAYALEEQH